MMLLWFSHKQLATYVLDNKRCLSSSTFATEHVISHNEGLSSAALTIYDIFTSKSWVPLIAQDISFGCKMILISLALIGLGRLTSTVTSWTVWYQRPHSVAKETTPDFSSKWERGLDMTKGNNLEGNAAK